jgi:hypothetical protein
VHKNSGMANTPDRPDILTLLRTADESVIRGRLAELEGEREALRALLRSVRARNRARSEYRQPEARKGVADA